MASDYAAIREQHLEDYGRKTSWRQSVLADRYSERTHFVYELLQNAEDAGATRVEFSLLNDRLEVRHDGRDFNQADVVAICAIAESTKPDDQGMIGRFGIGFKSVYAYTSEPQVHCPGSDEHFEIRDFVEPWPLEPREPGGRWTTLFVFPFDREDPQPAQSVEEISHRLVSLSPRTVLFLGHLREI
ncbi:MAG: sacsin N-terminal ATP-binding-like domain-containing protein [Gaiellaceae bacterium]